MPKGTAIITIRDGHRVYAIHHSEHANSVMRRLTGSITGDHEPGCRQLDNSLNNAVLPACPSDGTQSSSLRSAVDSATSAILGKFNTEFDLNGKAQESLGTALRVKAVRNHIGHDSEVLQYLGYVSAASPAFRCSKIGCLSPQRPL